jgi:uncharacterized RDD family membrane protein YckC
MTIQSQRYCMWCGTAMPAGTATCPSCGEPVAGVPHLPAAITREPAEPGPDIDLAPYWRRVGGWAIDTAIVSALLLGYAVLLVSTQSAADRGSDGPGAGLLFWPFVPLYSALCHRFWHGQTLGKRLFGIAVRRIDGSPIGLGQSLGRSYIRLAFLAFLPVWIADSVWPIWQHRRQALHDMTAGTIVIRKNGRP